MDLVKISQNTVARKKEIESDLSKITPILNTAQEAVNSIKRDNVSEICSLKTPPQAILDVLSSVLMLPSIKDLSWVSMKNFLGKRRIKEEILNFDARRIKPVIIKQVRDLVS